MEEWPSSITSFIHVVASHEDLWGEDWLLLSVLELESHLGNLGERDSVARTAVTLVSMLGGEVNTLDVSPVEVGWELTIWDSVGIWVLLLVLLGLTPGSSEVISLLKDFLFLVKISFGLGLGKIQSLLLAVRSITWMVLLELASICFPAEIHIVDSGNEEIVLIRCNMSMMSIVPLVRCFTVKFFI